MLRPETERVSAAKKEAGRLLKSGGENFDLATTQQVEQLIRCGETLRVEFKGEARRQMSDSEIYETVVCLANTEGGV